MEDAGRDHVVRGAGRVQQRSDLERVHDERRAVHLTALSLVQSPRVGERCRTLWQLANEPRSEVRVNHCVQSYR